MFDSINKKSPKKLKIRDFIYNFHYPSIYSDRLTAKHLCTYLFHGKLPNFPFFPCYCSLLEIFSF